MFAAGIVDPSSHQRLLATLSDADRTIVADGGLAHAVVLGRTVDALVGDLDSADPGQVAEVVKAGTDVERYPIAKDETDLELAMLRALESAPCRVTMVGLFGGRLDHELANLSLIAQRRWFDAGLRIVAEGGDRTVHFVHDEVELRESVGTTISVLPWLGSASGVTERGMRWDLTDATLDAGTSQGMSNVADAETQQISVEEGVLLVIVDRTP